MSVQFIPVTVIMEAVKEIQNSSEWVFCVLRFAKCTPQPKKSQPKEYNSEKNSRFNHDYVLII